MSLRQYVEAMERLGIKSETVLSALYRHADYIANHGLPSGIHPDQCGSDHWEAMKYGMECRRMVQEEANRRIIDGWVDREFLKQCTDELTGDTQ